MPQQEALRILGSHVYALHVQDNMGERDQHFAPFFGTMNPDSLMQGLLEIGYQGYFTFEPNLPPAVKRRPHEGEDAAYRGEAKGRGAPLRDRQGHSDHL